MALEGGCASAIQGANLALQGTGAESAVRTPHAEPDATALPNALAKTQTVALATLSNANDALGQRFGKNLERAFASMNIHLAPEGKARFVLHTYVTDESDDQGAVLRLVLDVYNADQIRLKRIESGWQFNSSAGTNDASEQNLSTAAQDTAKELAQFLGANAQPSAADNTATAALNPPAASAPKNAKSPSVAPPSAKKSAPKAQATAPATPQADTKAAGQGKNQEKIGLQGAAPPTDATTPPAPLSTPPPASNPAQALPQNATKPTLLSPYGGVDPAFGGLRQ